MSSVLHPVGPEPRERYWVRRVAVLVAAVVVIGVIIALVGNAMSAGSAVQADPAPPTIVATVLPATPSASPTPTPALTPTASPTPAGSPTPGVATPSSTSSESSSPGSVVTPDPTQKPKTEKSTPPTDADKRKAEAEAARKKAAAEKKAKAKVLATCPTGDLRQTLSGPRTVKATKSATFALTLTNTSKTSCYLKVTSANFTLTVVSGKDRIWSTQDCSSTVPSLSRKLAGQKSVGWKVTWDGHRSGSGCSKQKADPKAGYYWAIARYGDGREVRSRIILT